MLSASTPTAFSATAGLPPSMPLMSRSLSRIRSPVPVSMRMRFPPASTSSRLSRHRIRPRSSVSTTRDQSGLGTTPKNPPASGLNHPARTTRTRVSAPHSRASAIGVLSYSGPVAVSIGPAGSAAVADARARQQTITLEVAVVQARRRVALTAVLGADARVAVGHLHRGAHLLEADLPDLHPVVEGDE